MAAKTPALKIFDWSKVSSLGLKGQTAASLQAFKKRHDDIKRKVAVLSEMQQTVDFSHYRSTLKNKAIVDQIEKQYTAFKPATFDVTRQLKAIEAFESQAVKSAESTKAKVEDELNVLDAALKNIETARPFEELTVEDVNAAEPAVLQKTEQLVSQGRWMPPGYQEKFGNLSVV